MIDYDSDFGLYEERPENVKALKIIHVECLETLDSFDERYIIRLENCDKLYDIGDICKSTPCVGDYIVKDRNQSFGYEFMRRSAFDNKYKKVVE